MNVKKIFIFLPILLSAFLIIPNLHAGTQEVEYSTFTGDFSNGGDYETNERLIGNASSYGFGIIQDNRVKIYIASGSASIPGHTAGVPYHGFVGIQTDGLTQIPQHHLDVWGRLRSTDSAYFATSQGYVGIGTVNPDYKFKVVGGSVSLPSLFVNSVQIASATASLSIDTTTLQTNIDNLYGNVRSTVTQSFTIVSSTYNYLKSLTDDYSIFKPTAQNKIDSWTLSQSTISNKTNSWILSESTISSRLIAVEGFLNVGPLTPTATVQVGDFSQFGINFTTITGKSFTNYMGVGVSGNGQYVTIGSNDKIQTSSDYGVTYTTRATSTQNWGGCQINYTGQYQLITVGAYVYKSDDYGETWTTITYLLPSGAYYMPGVSATGQYMAFALQNGVLRVSDDYGVTADTVTTVPSKNFGAGVAVSSSGQYMLAAVSAGGANGSISSSDYGVTWSSQTTLINKTMVGSAISGNGRYQMLYAFNDNIYISTDYGHTFFGVSPALKHSPSPSSQNCAIDDTGQYMVINSGTGVKFSVDYGVTWKNSNVIAESMVNISRNGTHIVAPAYAAIPLKISESLVYDGGGAVGLNTITPSSKFEVINGSVTIRGVVSGISIRDNAGNTDFTVLNNGNVGIGIANPTYILHVNGEPAAVGYTAWTNASDIRLKENETFVTESALSKINQLKPVEYEYNDKFYSEIGIEKPKEKRKFMGFNAQDVQKIYPEMVSMKPLKTPYVSTQVETSRSYEVTITTDLGKGAGTKTITKTVTEIIPPKELPEDVSYYSLNTSNLQIYLTKAIQELSENYDKLKIAFCEKDPENNFCK